MKDLLEKFYAALSNLDPEGMIDCYHDEITFEDPAFGELHDDKARNMWRMLLSNRQGGDFRIEYSNIIADGVKGSAKLEAYYTFTKTGRKVHNRIKSEFLFKDGKIIKQRDYFDLYRWSRQALGMSGWILGWTFFFRNKLQIQSNRMLLKFEHRMKDPSISEESSLH